MFRCLPSIILLFRHELHHLLRQQLPLYPGQGDRAFMTIKTLPGKYSMIVSYNECHRDIAWNFDLSIHKRLVKFRQGHSIQALANKVSEMIGNQEQNKVWISMIISRSVAVSLLIDTCNCDNRVNLKPCCNYYVICMKWRTQSIPLVALGFVLVSGSGILVLKILIIRSLIQLFLILLSSISGTLFDDACSSKHRGRLIGYWYALIH